MSTPLNHNSSTEKNIEVENYENVQRGEYVATKPTFGQKAKRHCARFWWLHLIIFCAVFLLVALLVVYVGMPKIAQNQVNDATLELREGIFLNPTSDSLDITQKTILHNPSVFTPKLDAFPAEFFLVTGGVYGSSSMMTLPMPKIHANHGGTNASIENQVIQITNQDQLDQYTIAVMNNENITTALVGKTKLRLGSLPVQNVKFNSTSTYKGFNKLKGFNTTDLRLNLTVPAGQPNLKGIAQIPNASLMTIAMGNVTLSLSTEKAGVVGNATIQNFTLVPGNNSLPMTAIIDQPLVISSLDASGKVNMSITGQSSIYNGQHLTYYEAALKSNVLVLEMNVQQILKDSLAASA